MLDKLAQNQIIDRYNMHEPADISPEELKLRENRLLSDFEENRTKCDEDDYQLLVNRLFEHSVSDALKYSGDCSITNDEIKKAVTEPLFYLKHEALAREFKDQIKRNKQYINNSQEAQGLADKYAQYRADAKDGNFLIANLNQRKNVPWATQDKINDIDSYYLNFYKLQKVDLRSVNDLVSENRREELIARSLQRSKLALEDNYYSGEISSLLFKKIINETPDQIEAIAKKYFKNNQDLVDKYGDDFPRYLNALERGAAPSRDILLGFLRGHKEGSVIADILANSDLINSEQLEKIKKRFDLNDSIEQKRINQAKYKPLDLTYKTEKELTEKELSHSLNLSLQSHLGKDVEVELDRKTNQYVVPGYEVQISDKDSARKEITERDSTKEIAKKVNIVYATNTHKGMSMYFEIRADNRSFVISENGEIIGDKYDNVGQLTEINNQPYFIAIKNGQKFAVGPNGQSIGTEYDHVAKIFGINNLVYLSVRQNGQSCVIGPDGQKVGGEYDASHSFMEINKSLYFSASRDGEAFVVGPNGQKIGDEYDNVSNLVGVNNSPYFKGMHKGQQSVVGPDGQKIITVANNYTTSLVIKGANSLPYFEVHQNGKDSIYNKDGQLINDEYDNSYGVQEINGLLYFKASKNDSYFVVGPDGRKIGGEYDDVRSLTEINKLPYFVATQDGREFVVGPDGQKIGSEYEHINFPFEIACSLYYVAKIGRGNFIIDSEGEQIGGPYEEVFMPTEIKGLPYFEASQEGREFIVGPDGKKIGGVYSGVRDLRGINGLPYFRAIQGSQEFIVGPNDQRVGDEYEKILDWRYDEKSGLLIIIGERDGSVLKQEISISSEKTKEDLSDNEKEQLRILNLVHKPNIEDVDAYLEARPQKEKKKLNKSGMTTLSGALNSDKSQLIDMKAAKKDRLVSQAATQLLYKIYPEILENINKEKARQAHSSGFSGSDGFWGRMGFGPGGNDNGENRGGENSTDNQFNLQNQVSANTYEGSGFSENGQEAQEVFQLRESIEAMMVSNAFAKYDKSWTKLEFPLSKDVDTPFREITNTLLNVGNAFNVSLPKPVEARIIPERVKGIKEDGSEVKLELQINSLQEVVCVSHEKVKEIVYSFKMAEAVPPLMAINDEASHSFINNITHHESLTENIADLPEDLGLFVNSLNSLSPKERVIEIENFVRTNSYYDFKNGETTALKNNKNITEIIDIMELRAQELKERGEETNGKKYAGLCADFALLTTALLRQANFASGYLNGFNVSGTRATTDNAHACSFVLWPDGKGKTRIISLDGTPSGAESGQAGLEGVSTPSIKEREENFQALRKEKQAEVLKEIEAIEKKIKAFSEDELVSLNNGQLEDALNNILQYSVNRENLEAIEASLKAYWYSPLSKLDLKDIDNNIKATSFLEAEIRKARAQSSSKIDNPGEAGSLLFASLEDFLDKFNKANKNNSPDSSLKILEKVYDLSKANLNEIERKALRVTLRYLEAKKIKGDAK